jgi:hypothetical protein
MQKTGSIARRHNVKAEQLSVMRREEDSVTDENMPERGAISSKARFIRELFEIDTRDRTLQRCAREWAGLDQKLNTGKITEDAYEKKVENLLSALRKASRYQSI